MELSKLDVWKAAADLSPDPVAFVAPDDKFVWCNRAWVEMLGYTIAELKQRTWQSLTATEDIGGDMIEAGRLKEGEVPSYYFEKKYIRKNGELTHPVGIMVHRFPPSDAPMSGHIVFAKDAKADMLSIRLQAEYKQLSQTVATLQSEVERRERDIERIVQRNSDLIDSLTSRTSGNVTIGDVTGRDKSTNSDMALRVIAGVVIAGVIAVVWILYYHHGGTTPPPSQIPSP